MATEDERNMQAALAEARKARDLDETPVGAVVVREGEIIGRGYNRRETDADPTAHAEIIALRAAAKGLGDWRMIGCDLYVTLEPCPMCAGAMVLARLDRLIYGAADPKAGACGTLYDIVRDHRLNHRLEVLGGILADESKKLLQTFFRAKRLGKKPETLKYRTDNR